MRVFRRKHITDVTPEPEPIPEPFMPVWVSFKSERWIKQPSDVEIRGDADDTVLFHLDNIVWFDQTIPPTKHNCWAQTYAWLGLRFIERCACGALGDGYGWAFKNERHP